MQNAFRRLTWRLFYCLISLAFSVCAHAGPPTTTVNEGLFGHNTGNDKKQAALSFASAAIGVADAVASKDILDPAKFNDGLAKVIDGVVECFNASMWAKK